MIVSKIALGVAALGLSLTSLAVPAQASSAAPRDRDDRVEVNIRDVDVNRRGDIEVKVRYFCDDDRDGRLRVILRQDDARYSADERVECDGRGVETVTLEKDWGGLEDGRATVRAVLRSDGERAEDSERVWIDVRDRHHR